MISRSTLSGAMRTAIATATARIATLKIEMSKAFEMIPMDKKMMKILKMFNEFY